MNIKRGFWFNMDDIESMIAILEVYLEQGGCCDGHIEAALLFHETFKTGEALLQDQADELIRKFGEP
jgi:hypothetical protein